MGGEASPLTGTVEEGGFLMSAIRLTIWIARVLGTVTAILGWLFLTADSNITWIAHVPAIGTQLQGWLHWIANSTGFIFTHMVLGITFALLLLVLSSHTASHRAYALAGSYRYRVYAHSHGPWIHADQPARGPHALADPDGSRGHWLRRTCVGPGDRKMGGFYAD